MAVSRMRSQYKRFYSKLVRLEDKVQLNRLNKSYKMFLFQTGSIRSHKDGSITYSFTVQFLFQTGSIRRDETVDVNTLESVFLFQTGSIRSVLW